MKASVYLCEATGSSLQLSLDEQQRACAALLERAGLEPGDRYVDRDAARPELRRLLRALRDRARDGAGVVAVATIEVLGETARDCAVRVLQFGAAGADLRVASDRSAETALLQAWLQRGPGERRRERAVESMRRRALRGQALGRPPYGYRIEDRRLVPDPREADVVRRIFRMYLDEHEGVRRIAARLNAEGVPTRRGTPWNQVSIRAMLRNPVYTGTYRRLGVTIARAHPSLVSAGDFDAVQRRMAQRRTTKRAPQVGIIDAPREPRREEYLLAGLVWCGYCGGRMIGARRSGAGGELRYYQCASRANQGRCARHSWRADDLELAVVRRLAAGDSRRPVVAGEPPSPSADDEGRRRGLMRELERMLERWAAGQWTADQLHRRGGPIALELLDLEERAAEQAARPSVDTAEARERLVEQWDRLAREERRALLLETVREVLVTDDGVRVAAA